MSIWAESGPARKVRQIKTASEARPAAIFSIIGSPRERIFHQYIKKSPGRGGDGRGPWWSYFLKANSDDKAPGRPDHSKKPKNRKPQTGKRKTENGKPSFSGWPAGVYRAGPGAPPSLAARAPAGWRRRSAGRPYPAPATSFAVARG